MALDFYDLPCSSRQKIIALRRKDAVRGFFFFPRQALTCCPGEFCSPLKTEKPDIGNSMSGFEGAYSAG